MRPRHVVLAFSLARASCATYDLQEPLSPSSGLLIAQFNVVNLSPGYVKDVAVEIFDLDTGISVFVSLSSSGLLIVYGSDKDRLQLRSVSFETTRSIGTSDQPWVPSPNTQLTKTRFRFEVENGLMPAIRGSFVANLGVTSVSVFASTFAGEATIAATGKRIQSMPTDHSPVSLAFFEDQDRVENSFKRQFPDTAWADADWTP